MASLLRTVDLTVTYGGIRAVNELSIHLEPGQLVGLIGPNGAGKTTFIDALTGFVPTTGSVEFDGRDISTLAPHLRARAGLGRTWQSLELFDDLTVLENLQAAATRHTARRVLTDLVWPSRRRHVDAVDRAIEILQLETVVARMPSQLSQGQRKLVGVARAGGRTEGRLHGRTGRRSRFARRASSSANDFAPSSTAAPRSSSSTTTWASFSASATTSTSSSSEP